jgi:predicted transcriptional regulator
VTRTGAAELCLRIAGADGISELKQPAPINGPWRWNDLLIQSAVIRGNEPMDAIPDFTRDILVSIRPRYASKILDGKKTVELRRKFPQAAVVGATALIYSSSPVRAVVGYAQIRRVLKLPVPEIWKEHGAAACLSKSAFDAYFADREFGFAILFERVRSLKKQIEAIDLKTQFGIVPPQSYRYVTEECVALLSDERFQTADRHTHRYRAGRPSARSSVAG